MNKEEFLLALYDRLGGLPVEDIERSINYYREMIDERVEDGMTEEEAVAALGPMDEIVGQIVEDVPLTALVRERVVPMGGLRPWEIILLVLGFPVWFPLLLTGAVLVLAVYIVIWAVIVILFAVLISLVVTAAALVVYGVVKLAALGLSATLMVFGGAAVLLGAALLLWEPVLALAKLLAKLTGRFWRWVKHQFVGRGGDDR